MQYYQKNVALGSDIEISLVTSLNKTSVTKLFRDLWKYIYTFERQFSRFLPGSELSIFNQKAGIKQIISPEFREILVAASDISEETDGLYNPFILPALQAAGYGASLVSGHEHDVYDDHSHKSVVNVDRLEIGDDWARVPYGTALDLGGCGKGFVADKLADLVVEHVEGYWFSLGGDIVVGGHDNENQAWEINIQDVQNPNADIGRVIVPAETRFSVASSGTLERAGQKAGKSWHHLIDPRTLRPADTDTLLATVCGSSGIRADVFASCFVIIGSKNAKSFLNNHHIESCLLQYKTSDKKYRTRTFGPHIELD